MNLHPSSNHVTARQFAVAAESIAASQFALNGFDVLEQAGQARFAYELGVANARGMLKVAVYASVGEYWDPLNTYQTSSAKDGFSRAVDLWCKRHGEQVICLVHFDALDLGRMPKIYLASASELAQRLVEIRIERAGSWQLERELGVDGFVSMHDLPAEWRFSQDRIADLMKPPAVEPFAKSRTSATPKIVGRLVAA